MGYVIYQIIHCRKVRSVNSGEQCYPDEFNESTQEFHHTARAGRSQAVSEVERKTQHDMATLTDIIRQLDNSNTPYTADNIAQRFQQRRAMGGVKAFMENVIARKMQTGRKGTARNYATTLRSFMRFLGGKDITLNDITPGLMEEYEAWNLANGVEKNTSSFYMRILRTVYNLAIESGMTEDKRPFRHVYTGVAKTVKRAVPLDTVKTLRQLDIQGLSSRFHDKRTIEGLELARDIFLFSFYTRGMAFVDMAFLRKADVRNGVITYKRRKTRQRITIRYEKEMQEIVEKYNNGTSPFLLPIIQGTDKDKDPYDQYKNRSGYFRKYIRMLGEVIGTPNPLTMYVARHTWATAMRAANVPLSVISMGMGHDSETTTQIYLASVDTGAVDNFNSMLIGMV